MIDKDEQKNQRRHFSEDTMQSLQELGAVLDRVYKRLQAEGYVIIDDKLYKDGVIIDEI